MHFICTQWLHQSKSLGEGKKPSVQKAEPLGGVFGAKIVTETLTEHVFQLYFLDKDDRNAKKKNLKKL